MTIESNGRDTRPRDDTRGKILEAALELFGAQGFDSTTVREIAQRVGLTDAALYYHFKSKREILTSLWDVPFGGVSRLRPGESFSEGELDAITDAAVQFSAANDHILRLMCREALCGDQTAHALRLQNRAFLRRALHEHFGTIVEAEEADLRSEAVMALITGATMRTQMQTGTAYRAVAESEEFAGRVRRWARILARLEEAEAV
jgi:AcrR family transcriptional regulator